MQPRMYSLKSEMAFASPGETDAEKFVESESAAKPKACVYAPTGHSIRKREITRKEIKMKNLALSIMFAIAVLAIGNVEASAQMRKSDNPMVGGAAMYK